jgi:hypothetical protein
MAALVTAHKEQYRLFFKKMHHGKVTITDAKADYVARTLERIELSLHAVHVYA